MPLISPLGLPLLLEKALNSLFLLHVVLQRSIPSKLIWFVFSPLKLLMLLKGEFEQMAARMDGATGGTVTTETGKVINLT